MQATRFLAHPQPRPSLGDPPRRASCGASKFARDARTGNGNAGDGVRAPSFDIPPDHFDLLVDTGYEYDSSVVPCRKIPGWYGGEWSMRHLCDADQLVEGAPSNIAELPIAVMPWVGLPLTGTWLRFFGVRYTILGMHLLARQGIVPVLYVHPWEFCELPTIAGVPRRIYWRSGEWMQRALTVILNQKFEFVTARSVVEKSRNRS